MCVVGVCVCEDLFMAREPRRHTRSYEGREVTARGTQ